MPLGLIPLSRVQHVQLYTAALAEWCQELHIHILPSLMCSPREEILSSIVSVLQMQIAGRDEIPCSYKCKFNWDSGTGLPDSKIQAFSHSPWDVSSTEGLGNLPLGQKEELVGDGPQISDGIRLHVLLRIPHGNPAK